MTKHKDGYLGNPNLKPVGVQQQFTPKQVQEYIKCSNDPIYFIQNYVKIVSVDKGLVGFDMYDYQQSLIKTLHDNRFVIGKLPRQTGKTTTVGSYLLHYLLFNQNVNVAILANKQATAIEILSRIKMAFEYLPKWLQQGVVEWNKGSIVLENGSRILAAATSSSAIRGGSFNIILLDEFAHIPIQIAEDFFSSVYPTITSGQSTKMFIISTPNGLNMFYYYWKGAINKQNGYVPVEVHWSQVPKYPGGPLRDEKWKTEMISKTSEKQFQSEFECDFVGSSNTLISSQKLHTMIFDKPQIRTKEGLTIHEEPIREDDDKKTQDHIYFITVDTARGQGKDYSAFVVVDVTQFPYKVVAQYKNNTVSPLLYPSIIRTVAKKYNNAYVMIEINDIGSQVADILHTDLEYEFVVKTSFMGRKGQTITEGFGAAKQNHLGIKTSVATKKVGCAVLKNLIEEDKLLITDFDIINELTTFVAKKNSYEADDGHNDDLVTCLTIFAWCTRQEFFRNLTDMDVRLAMYQKEIEKIEDDMLPFGYYIDGTGEDITVEEDDWTGDSDDRWLITEKKDMKNWFKINTFRKLYDDGEVL